MSKNPTVNITVHTNDETSFEALRVASSSTDFATVKIGWDVSILLKNPAQAKALARAAGDAYLHLVQIEAEGERASWDKDEKEYCTDWNPCHVCLTEEDSYH